MKALKTRKALKKAKNWVAWMEMMTRKVEDFRLEYLMEVMYRLEPLMELQ